MWTVLVLLLVLLFSLQHGLVRAVPVLYVKLGEEARFKWNLELNREQLHQTIWILNQKGKNVFWFSSRGNGTTDPYKERIIFTGNVNNGLVKFTLLNTKANDAGTYSTFHRSSQSRGQELIVFDTPSKPIIEEITDPVLNRTLILNCTTESNSVSLSIHLKMNFTWLKNNREICTGNSYTVSGSTLSLPVLKISDSETIFTCFAIESCCNMASQESNTYILHVQYGPRLLHLQPNFSIYYIEEGQNLEKIIAMAICEPICATYWSKENDTQFRSAGPTLSLPNVKADKTGVYVFHARNNIDEATLRLSIIVTDSPPAPYVIPSSAVVSEHLVLSCSNSSDTEPRVKLIFSVARYTWRTSVQYTQQSERYHINESRFELKEVNRQDDGTVVSCSFTTESGKTSMPSVGYAISTKYGPEKVLLSTDSAIIRAREGRQLDNITCSTECNPYCIFEWHKEEDQYISHGNILSLGNITAEKSGKYFCQAFNDYGNRTSAKIDIGLLVITTKESYTCIENEKVRIACSLDENAFDMKFLPWIHSNNNVTIRYLNGRKSELNSDLTIYNCNFYDAGKYECRAYRIEDATGELETAKSSLTVFGSPRFLDAKTLISTTQTSIIFRFISHPPIKSFIWYRSSDELLNKGKFKMSSGTVLSKERIYTASVMVNVSSVKLDISDFSTSDHGYYTVTVRNEFGQNMQSIYVEKKDLKSLTWILSISAGGLGLFVIIVIIALRICLVKRRRKKEIQVVLQQLRLRIAERNKEHEKDESRRKSDDSNMASNTPSYDDINHAEVQMTNMRINEMNEDNEECTVKEKNVGHQKFSSFQNGVQLQDKTIYRYRNQAYQVSDMPDHPDDAHSSVEFNDLPERPDDAHSSIDVNESNHSASTGNHSIMDNDLHSSTSYDDIEAVISVSDVPSVHLPSDEQEQSSYEDLGVTIKPSSYLEIGDNDAATANKKKEMRVSYGVESNLADDELSSTSDS